MVEQTHAGEGHGDAVLVALFDDQIVTDGAAGLSDVLNAGSNAALDGVGEGEESVGAQRHSVTGIQPCPLLFSGEGLGTDGEVVLPDALCADVFLVAVDVAVDDIVPVGRPRSGRNFSPRVFGCWRRNQVSALVPARRVQWIRDCWPAPTPMAWPS